MNCNKHKLGFSILELLVVVAVILIITAVALPSLLRSKMSANEASAVGSLRAIDISCINYSTTWSTGFPVSLSNLGPGRPATSSAADLIDALLASGTKSGYTFTYVSGSPTAGKITTYTVQANPQASNIGGARHFFTDQTNVIRYSLGSIATVSSRPLP